MIRLRKLPPFNLSRERENRTAPLFRNCKLSAAAALWGFGASIMGTNAIIAHSVIPFSEWHAADKPGHL